jgi:hypothetical protein
MNQQQTERLITALESIAASLGEIDRAGLDVHPTGPDHIRVNAVISAPDGIQITRMPDEHFVQVFNPQSFVTGDIKPFITKAN